VNFLPAEEGGREKRGRRNQIHDVNQVFLVFDGPSVAMAPGRCEID